MNEPQRPRRILRSIGALLAGFVLVVVLSIGTDVALRATGAFPPLGQPMAEARTIAMNVFVAIEIVYLFNCRSLRLPVTAVAAFSNPWVWAGTGLQLVLQMAITYWAPLNAAFATAPIGARAWGEITVISLVAMGIVELEKRWRR